MYPSDMFKGRTTIVTGGGRGIGKAYCEAFAAHGASLVVADVDGRRAEEVASSLRGKGGAAIGVAVDVRNEDSVNAMVERAVNEFGRVDHLINNAAIMLDVDVPFKPFWETSLAEWNRIMEVNVSGVFLCCKAVKPAMERQGEGRIVNISSDAIWKGYESQLAYFASKGAVAVMTRNLAREMGPFMVTVNAIAPGYTLSEAVLTSPEMQGVRDSVMRTCCIKRDQYPEDVAGAALYLCSPGAACVTGQIVVVNCGAVMH